MVHRWRGGGGGESVLAAIDQWDYQGKVFSCVIPCGIVVMVTNKLLANGLRFDHLVCVSMRQTLKGLICIGSAHGL